MAEVYLPSTLPPLSRGFRAGWSSTPRQVGDIVEQLNASWPGFRDRLCEPGPAIRPHIHFYVDRERATLDTRSSPAPGST
jgi:hypothetical protein